MKHEHDWKRSGPFVVPLGESYRYGTSETYNSECATCGKRAWLHWPEQRFNEHTEDVP